MKNVFPLLDLPHNVLKNVLRIMEILDAISFSFVSNQTKTLVVPINLGSPDFDIVVKNTFDVNLDLEAYPSSLTFQLCRENGVGPVPLTIADTVEVQYLYEVYNWRKEGYGVRDWIDHLMAVTNQSTISMIEFKKNEEIFRLDSIKSTLRGLDIKTLGLFGDFSLPYLLDIVASFPLKMLQMFHVHNPSPVELHSVFAQNFDALEVDHMPGLSVNELVIMNTKFMEIHLDEGEQLNRFNSFLKMWKTGSNRRLEYLYIQFPMRTINEAVNVILKGIKHQVIFLTLVRQFKRPAGVDNLEEMIKVAGGFDVQGNDGRNVTVSIKNGFCQMFFWSK